ncbi:MAG: citrate synthase [Bacteroidia bacterium]|nr:citrate synthase [Bacteroidia bacterium]MCO5254650.1 citrate synthase [Bacteroidota bacterium]
MSETAKIILEGKEYELPVITGSENEKAIDISNLRGLTGYVTLDTGYKNTGATTSSITFLDGEKGILRYRGYSIEELAEKATFTEVAYLLLEGELPTQTQLHNFNEEIKVHTLVNEDLQNIFKSFPTGSHPMGQLISMMSALSAYYPKSLNPNRPDEQKRRTMLRLIAKMPTLCAMIYKKRTGHPFIYPSNKLDYVSNFLNMTFKHVSDDYEIDPVFVDAMNKLLILHADHEQNCSTSTVRLVGSSNASLYASIASGVAALWGPLHGGANQQVLEMLEQIKEDGGDVMKFINKAKDKNDPFRLMGFGHRVYKNFDPRARIIKKASDDVLNKLGIHDPILEIAKKLEEVALQDPYFVERKLYPNVDFYSGIIYKAMGFPTDMFTVMFALGRLPGWIAQWKEMIKEGQPIGRPRQIYTGSTLRPFTPIKNR